MPDHSDQDSSADSERERLFREFTQMIVRSEMLGGQRGRFIQAVVAVEATLDELIAEHFNIASEQRESFFGTLMRHVGLGRKVDAVAMIVRSTGVEEQTPPNLLKRLREMVEFRNLCAHAATAGNRGDSILTLRQFNPDGTTKTVAVEHEDMERRISGIRSLHRDLLQFQGALRPDLPDLEDGLRRVFEMLSPGDTSARNDAS